MIPSLSQKKKISPDHIVFLYSSHFLKSEAQGQEREKEKHHSSSVLILSHAKAPKPTDDFMSSSFALQMLQAEDKPAAFNSLYTANWNCSKCIDAFTA